MMRTARWSDALKNRKSSDETWLQMKGTSAPYIAGAETALAAGQRGLALYQLARTRLYLAGAEFVGKRSASDRNDMAALEAAWKRSGRTLAPDVSPPSARTLARVSPAIVRAVAEIAYPQVHDHYHASLDFARNTNAESGFYYLGLAHGQEGRLSRRSLAGRPVLRPSGSRAVGPIPLCFTYAPDPSPVCAWRPPASWRFAFSASLVGLRYIGDGAGARPRAPA